MTLSYANNAACARATRNTASRLVFNRKIIDLILKLDRVLSTTFLPMISAARTKRTLPSTSLSIFWRDYAACSGTTAVTVLRGGRRLFLVNKVEGRKDHGRQFERYRYRHCHEGLYTR